MCSNIYLRLQKLDITLVKPTFMISVKNLKKSFQTVKAIDGLSFNIKKGEIIGFLGPNGAGKSTTMRLLTGYLSPDTGTINIDGDNIQTNLHTIQSKIGYLPENNPLYKDMLVSEILTLNADLKKIPKSKRKEAFDFVISAVDIDDVYYRRIGDLSKGYKQRVGMALALMHKPTILIMDEPTEGLDPNQRTEIRSLIKELAKDRTIIVSTHVMSEATAIASRLLIINKGKLVADDTPKNLTLASGEEKVLEIELQGAKIATTLKKVKDITDIKSEKISSNRFNFRLVINKEANIQPTLTKLAGKNNWTIWKLVEHENNLEDVFHKLTSK